MITKLELINVFNHLSDGFRKVSNIENSGLRSERDDIEFYNQHFIKGREFELEFIKRKVPLKVFPLLFTFVQFAFFVFSLNPLNRVHN
jgi:hypothetical protein